MIRSKLSLGFIALMFGLSTSIAAAAPPVANPHPTSGNLIVFGDSQADGEGSTLPESPFDRCLQKAFPNFTASKYAERGASTFDGVRMLQQLLLMNPRIVVISLGGNDLTRVNIPRVPAEKTFENMTFIYRELVSRGVMVVQLGLNPPLWYARRLPKLQKYAEAEGVLYVPDILEGLWLNPSYMSDLIHPNDEGYRIACERIVPAMAPYLQPVVP